MFSQIGAKIEEKMRGRLRFAGSEEVFFFFV